MSVSEARAKHLGRATTSTKKPTAGRAIAQRIYHPKGATRIVAKYFIDSGDGLVLRVDPKTEIVEYANAYNELKPMDIVDLERAGVQGKFLKVLSRRMNVRSSRMFEILGVPKATAEKKASTNAVVSGTAGQAAISIVRLLGIASEVLKNSTAEGTEKFDTAEWLGKWIERPQPALGGKRPADMLDSPTGVEAVSRLLGSFASGAYQ